MRAAPKWSRARREAIIAGGAGARAILQVCAAASSPADQGAGATRTVGQISPRRCGRDGSAARPSRELARDEFEARLTEQLR